MTQRTHYSSLATLFKCPESEYPKQVRIVRSQITDSYPEATETLDHFIKLLPEHDLRMMQELYIRSFDVQAITTLDIGYVLFGDDYKRGQLLSNLNREHIEHNVDCGHELADHLPNVLSLIEKLEDGELLLDLIDKIVAPALHQMISEFDDDRIIKKQEAYEKHYKTLIETPSSSSATTLFQYPLQAVYQVMKKDFSIAETFPKMSDFLQTLNKENELEEGKKVINKGMINGELMQ